MNRIQLWPGSDEQGNSLSEIQQAVIRRGSHHGCNYSLFAPLHYEPKYAYPLLIWLHGPGADERQIQRIMPLVSMRNYVAIGPRGVRQESPTGYDWGTHDGGVTVAEQSVFDSIDIVREKFQIASDRIFIGGYQSGGTMAFRIAMSHPEQFAGVVSIDGGFPVGDQTLTSLEIARKLPLFIAVGEDAKVYSVEHACEDLRLFHTAGMAVTLRQYPCGDEIVSRMLGDMDRWLMEQITGLPVETEEFTYLQLKSWN